MSTAPYRQLQAGDHAPWFDQRNTSNPVYAFDTVGGRYILLCFFGSAAQESARRRLQVVADHRDLFDDQRVSFFGVSIDADDEATGRVRGDPPGVRHFWDFDRRVCRLYGALPAADDPSGHELFRPLWVLLNPNLQVRAVVPFAGDGSDLLQVPKLLGELPPVERFPGIEQHAPVLLLPDVFEPALCSELIAQYEQAGGTPTGFMRDVGDKTVAIDDGYHKVRRDHIVTEPDLRRRVRARIQQRVASAIRHLYFFDATHLERYLVSCYHSSDGGHFRPHRDNTTRGTAHRRFAVSINLNDDFDGGTLVFPEYGPRRYKPPPGAAVVFSCTLLHGVDPVVRGQRYAFLPFLYDNEGARVREANAAFLSQRRPQQSPLHPGADAPVTERD